jgi:hypothetical protein
MNEYTIKCQEEIHCNGKLMTPEEIVIHLQLADTMASFFIQEKSEKIKIPRDAMESKEAFIKWIEES